MTWRLLVSVYTSWCIASGSLDGSIGAAGLRESAGSEV